MKIKAFITHKINELFADCQDRFALNSDTKSIAVSDGMGSTWQQKIWAQLLVDEFVKNTEWQPNIETIKPLCVSWRKRVVDFIENQKLNGAPEHLIFRNERNLLNGISAGATFVGIRFDGQQWYGSVLGDSCLIEWDGNDAKFHTSKELQELDVFDSFPDYFDSNPTKEGRGTPKPIKGGLSEGKYLLMVSDPFSDFLWEHRKLKEIDEYIKQLLTISSHEDFERLVDDWRQHGMHNDDTTLVIIEYDGSDSIVPIYQDDIESLKKIEKETLDAKAQAEIVETKEMEPEDALSQDSTNFVENDSIPSSLSDDENQVEKHVAIEDRKSSHPQKENENEINPHNIPESSLVGPHEFIQVFIKQYRINLNNNPLSIQGTRVNHIGKIGGKMLYELTRKAAKAALEDTLENYSIINK